LPLSTKHFIENKSHNRIEQDRFQLLTKIMSYRLQIIPTETHARE